MRLKEFAIRYIEIPLVTPFKTFSAYSELSVNDLITKVTAEGWNGRITKAPPAADYHR